MSATVRCPTLPPGPSVPARGLRRIDDGRRNHRRRAFVADAQRGPPSPNSISAPGGTGALPETGSPLNACRSPIRGRIATAAASTRSSACRPEASRSRSASKATSLSGCRPMRIGCRSLEREPLPGARAGDDVDRQLHRDAGSVKLTSHICPVSTCTSRSPNGGAPARAATSRAAPAASAARAAVAAPVRAPVSRPSDNTASPACRASTCSARRADRAPRR